MREIVLAKCGELVLKGLNRSRFESVLLKNLKAALAPLGEVEVHLAQSTAYIEPASGVSVDAVLETAGRVFGFVGVCRAVECDKDIEKMEQAAVQYLSDKLQTVKTFKVESKRADKRFPLKSPEISRRLGGVLLHENRHLSVDVHHPDVVVMAEVREQHAYLHAGQLPGAGGMPYGTGGKSVLLLSGGIDSPVAAYMMARRGVRIEPLHFFSPPYTGDRALQKVTDLANILQQYCPGMVLRTVYFTEVQKAILENCREDLFTVIMRRFMMRIAYAVMQKTGAESLITGESLGQVASQTMAALTITDATTPALTLRPLIGMDKEEIVRISRKIGTFETSTLPYEDCCTVFTPKHPKTRPLLQEIEAQEAHLDVQALVERALAHIEITKLGGTDYGI